MTLDDLAAGAMKRFHPAHFRDRIGVFFYDLSAEELPHLRQNQDGG